VLTQHPEAEFVQLQINYADWENPAIASRACYEVARKHGKPVIIMEPVKGGLLANPPEREWRSSLGRPSRSTAPPSGPSASPPDLEGVITVLSGMSSLEQMEDNLSYMKTFKALTPAERETIARAREALNAIR
jgi:predicted aldo/keto reductase-like oxidoreductase